MAQVMISQWDKIKRSSACMLVNENSVPVSYTFSSEGLWLFLNFSFVFILFWLFFIFGNIILNLLIRNYPESERCHFLSSCEWKISMFLQYQVLTLTLRCFNLRNPRNHHLIFLLYPGACMSRLKGLSDIKLKGKSSQEF